MTELTLKRGDVVPFDGEQATVIRTCPNGTEDCPEAWAELMLGHTDARPGVTFICRTYREIAQGYTVGVGSEPTPTPLRTRIGTTTYTCGHEGLLVLDADDGAQHRFLAVVACPDCRLDALEARYDALLADLHALRTQAATSLDATDSRLDRHTARLDALTEHTSFEAHWDDPNPCAEDCPYWSTNLPEAANVRYHGAPRPTALSFARQHGG